MLKALDTVSLKLMTVGVAFSTSLAGILLEDRLFVPRGFNRNYLLNYLMEAAQEC